MKEKMKSFWRKWIKNRFWNLVCALFVLIGCVVICLHSPANIGLIVSLILLYIFFALLFSELRKQIARCHSSCKNKYTSYCLLDNMFQDDSFHSTMSSSGIIMFVFIFFMTLCLADITCIPKSCFILVSILATIVVYKGLWGIHQYTNEMFTAPELNTPSILASSCAACINLFIISYFFTHNMPANTENLPHVGAIFENYIVLFIGRILFFDTNLESLRNDLKNIFSHIFSILFSILYTFFASIAIYYLFPNLNNVLSDPDLNKDPSIGGPLSVLFLVLVFVYEMSGILIPTMINYFRYTHAYYDKFFQRCQK